MSPFGSWGRNFAPSHTTFIGSSSNKLRRFQQTMTASRSTCASLGSVTRILPSHRQLSTRARVHVLVVSSLPSTQSACAPRGSSLHLVIDERGTVAGIREKCERGIFTLFSSHE